MPNVIDLSGGMSSGRRLTPQEQLAQAMLQQGVSGAPVRHPMEGIGRIAQALAGAYISKLGQDKREKEATAGTQDMAQMAALIAGGQRGGMQSTGGAGGDQVADVPAVEPGLSAFSEGMRRHGTSPAVQRNMPQMLALAQAYQKDNTAKEFNLGEGQKRFRVNSQTGAVEEIASGPEKPRDQFRPLTSQEKTERGLPAGAIAQINDRTGEVKTSFAPQGPAARDQFRLMSAEEKAQRGLPADAVIQVNSTTGQINPVSMPQAAAAEPVTVKMPDGSVKAFDKRDPALKSAMDSGGVPVRIGVNSPDLKGAGITNPTRNDLEAKIVNATEGLARVAQIGKSFKPEYQQLGTRWQAMTAAFKEKVGFEPDPQSKALLSDFSAYKREALNNLNLYIKEITGAAMSEAEATRITRALPNPGTGLMDGDSPTEFQAKMDSVQRELRGVVARANYARNNGLDPMKIPLEKVPDLMRTRMIQIQDEMKLTQPDLEPDAMRGAVKNRLLKEFGIPADA